MNSLTPREENHLNEVIVSLHPHKALLEDWKPRFYVIRKGFLKRLLHS